MEMSWRTVAIIVVTLQCLALMGYAAVEMNKLTAIAVIVINCAVSFWAIGRIAPDIKGEVK